MMLHAHRFNPRADLPPQEDVLRGFMIQVGQNTHSMAQASQEIPTADQSIFTIANFGLEMARFAGHAIAGYLV